MSEEEIEKVKKKISNWFKNPEQINSQILIEFLKFSNRDSQYTSYQEFEKACIHISDFSSNYNQMKKRNHEQVLSEYNGYIRLQTDMRNFILNRYEIFLFNKRDNQIIPINIKNIILYGVAGVGKTHNTNKLISLIESGEDEKEIFRIIKENENSESVDISDIKNRVKFITFHQSFGYEDFIEGFRPTEEGKIELVDGVFKSIALEASKNIEENYYLIIDEINRGNISKIFGELITLIEENKRDNLEVILPYSKEPFSIPSNLYIIGTMNSSDKSIALIDIALRRRFTFLKMKPKDELIPQSSRELFRKLNEYILETLGEDYLIGHSYFMGGSDLDFVLEYQIKPLLEEYFYGDSEGLKRALEIIEEIR